MGKRKKSRVRAQRKFAQGAYVPPQTTPLSASTQVTMRASHRAVRDKGPVTVNGCNVSYLLNVLSLGSVQKKKIDWPLLILEDCAKSVNNIPAKKKIVVKKNTPTRVSLRNKRTRLSSVSDSGEDTPLSRLQNLQDTSSRREQTERKKKVALDKGAKVVVERQDINRRKSLTPSSEPEEPPKRRSMKRHLNAASSHSKSNLPHSLPGSDDQHDKTLTTIKRTSKRCARRSRPTYYPDAPSLITSTASTSSTKHNQLLKERAVKEIQQQNKITRRPESKIIISQDQYNEDIASMGNFMPTSKEKSDLAEKSKSKATEIVLLDDDVPASLVLSNIMTLPEDPLKLEATASSDMSVPSSSDMTVPSSSDMSVPSSSDMSVPSSSDMSVPSSSDMSVPTSSDMSVPSLSDIPLPSPSNNSIPSSSYNFMNMETVKSDEDIDIDDDFYMYTVPALYKIRCPLQPIVDLHKLLTSTEVGCKTCARCLLVTMYKTTLASIKFSREDEPDIDIQDKQPPPCPYNSHLKSNANQDMKQREKVCNVLTSKTLPIWLINFQIDSFCMQMFEIEHKAGTLKRTLNLDPADAENALVEKVIARLQYLDRCIMHDNFEPLPKDFQQTRLRSNERPPIEADIVVLESDSDDSIEEVALASLAANEFPPINTDLVVSESDSDDSIGEVTLALLAAALRPSSLKSNTEPMQFIDPQVYRPTREEFKDPITYIKSIEPQASKYGMCKIIPPDDFNVPCHLDENVSFGTYNQYLNRLYQRWGPNTRMFAILQTSMKSQAAKDKECCPNAPLFVGLEVDLQKLYHLVAKQGGIEGYMSRTVKWARIAAQMNYVSPCCKPDWKKLESIYCKHVLPYQSLTTTEKKDASEKADKMWRIRVKNALLRASQPLHYQTAMLSDSNLPEYEETFPDADLAELYDQCGAIYDKIEECISKGRSMNLATFRRVSTQFQGMRFPNGLPSTIAEIENKYWEILNLRNEHVCVLSAFIDTSVNNLGHETDPHKPGGSHAWNLKRIGENHDNVLRSLGKALSVTVPTLCLNQLYSTNCWHKDPHRLAWLDYMHEGATKIWYSVPELGARAFQGAVQMMSETSVQDKGIWLASDTTMIPPGNLMSCGVPVQRIEQNPNEYIVVFPGAYACSISTGFSVAESIYFENDSWLDRVETVFEDMHKDCEPAMFSSVLLLMNMARNPTLDVDVLNRVCTILKKQIKAEFEARREAQWLNCRVTTDKRGRKEGNLLPVSWPNQEECCLCRMPLVLSKMSKYDAPRKQMCITHGMQYMRRMNRGSEADRVNKPPVLTLHYTNHELLEMMGTLEIFIMPTK